MHLGTKLILTIHESFYEKTKINWLWIIKLCAGVCHSDAPFHSSMSENRDNTLMLFWYKCTLQWVKAEIIP